MPTTETPRRAPPEATKPDYFALQKEREELLQALGVAGTELSKQERFQLAVATAEHSVKDGLESAERLGLQPGDKRRLLTHPNVYKKHARLADTVRNKLMFGDNWQYLDNQENASTFIRAFDSLPLKDSGLEKLKRQEYNFRSPAAKSLANRISRYYLPFIAQHSAAPLPAEEDPRTKMVTKKVGAKEIQTTELSGEQMAEQLLGQLRRGFDKNIYSSFPRQLAAEYLRKEKLSRDATVSFTKKEHQRLKKLLSVKEADALLYGNYLPEEQTIAILEKLGVDTQDPKFKRRLKANRYAMSDIVFDASRSVAEKGLKEEFTDMLAKRGLPKDRIEFEWDEEAQEYKVMLKKRKVEKAKEAGKREAKPELLDLGEFENNEIDLGKYPNAENFTKAGKNVVFTNSAFGGTELDVICTPGANAKVDRLSLGNVMDKVNYIVDHGGTAVIAGEKNGQPVLVGNKGVDKLGDRFTKIGKLVVLEDKLYFRATLPDGRESLLVEESPLIAADEIGDPQIINGKTIAWSRKGGWIDINNLERQPAEPVVRFTLAPGEQVVNVQGGIAVVKLAKTRRHLIDPTKAEEVKIVYPIQQAIPVNQAYFNDLLITELGVAYVDELDVERQTMVYPDGRRSEEFKQVNENFKEIDEQIYATVARQSAWESVLYPDHHVGKKFLDLKNPVKFNGRLYLAAMLDDCKWYILADDETTKLSEPFDEIKVFENSNGYFVISGIRDGKLVTYSHPSGPDIPLHKAESSTVIPTDPERSRGGVEESRGEFEWDWSKFKKEEIGEAKRFPDAAEFTQVGQKIGFKFRESNYESAYFEGNKVTYEKIQKMASDGKNLFTAAAGIGAQYLLRDLHQTGDISNVSEQGDPVITSKGIAQRLRRGKDWIVRYPDGKESKEYSVVGNPIEINGEIVFWTFFDSLDSIVAVHENGSIKAIFSHPPEVTPERIVGVTDRGIFYKGNNGWTCIYSTDKLAEQSVIISDCAELFPPVAIEGGIAFVVKKNNGKFAVIKRVAGKNREVGDKYDEIGKLVPTGDSVTFRARVGNKEFIIFPDGNRSDEDEKLTDPIFVSGHIIFGYFVSGPNKWLLADRDDDIPLSVAFDEIKLLSAEHGYIVVTGVQDGKLVNYSCKIDDLKKSKEPTATPPSAVAEVSGEEKSEPIELTEEEKRKVGILNAVHYPTEERVRALTAPPTAKKSFMQQAKEMLQRSWSAAGGISQDIQENPEAYLKTIVAVKDDLSPGEIQRIVEQLFPEIPINRARAASARTVGYGEPREGDNFADVFKASPQDYLRLREVSVFADGDPLEKDEDSPVVLEMREPAPRFIATGLFGEYDRECGEWQALKLPIAEESAELVREHTWTVAVGNLREVALPKMIGAKILPERIKGITADGREIALTAKFNNWGQAVVVIPSEAEESLSIEKIVYSQSLSEVQPVPADITEKQLDRFKKELAKTPEGKALLDPTLDLPADLNIFAASIKEKSPKERMAAVEAFVRTVCYYDFHNREASHRYRGKKLPELLKEMEERMRELKSRDPEIAKHTELRYAGVCAHFTEFTAAFLRAAGIPSGTMSGFNPKDRLVIRTKHAHGKNFALLPSEIGFAEFIEVDGTPSGVTERERKLLAAIQAPSLLEKEKLAEEQEEQLAEVARVRFEEIRKIVRSGDMRKIRELSNGELEGLFNRILKTVTEGQTHVAQTLLSALLYSPYKLAEFGRADADTKVALHKFLAAEVYRDRGAGRRKTKPAGRSFMESLTDFIKRAENLEPNRERLFADLHAALDLIHNDLTLKEQAAIESAVTYLEAKQMKKETGGLEG